MRLPLTPGRPSLFSLFRISTFYQVCLGKHCKGHFLACLTVGTLRVNVYFFVCCSHEIPQLLSTPSALLSARWQNESAFCAILCYMCYNFPPKFRWFLYRCFTFLMNLVKLAFLTKMYINFYLILNL